METDGTPDAALQPTEAGWHADPFGRFERRWWDGDRWSEKVSTGRAKALDPPGVNTMPTQFGTDEPAPADPITDATLPIRAPSPWGQLTYALGLLVFAGLLILVVLFLSGIIGS